MKQCTKCKRVLDESEFNKNRHNPDGLQSVCRACASEYNRRRYASRRSEFQRKIYGYRRDNPNKVLETRLGVCAAKPTHKNAYRAVEAAIDCGVLHRPVHCQACGCHCHEHRIEAHHSNYAHPLDVIWLCTPCHRKADMSRREHEEKIKAGA